jgi:purine-nucleoside phosphorylase
MSLFSAAPAMALPALAAHGVRAIDLAIVLGTGLGDLADEVENARAIPYSALPGFPSAGVSGHAGRLVVGALEGRRVALMQGRAHYYEHGDPRVMGEALKAFAGLGAKAVLLTNSAGSLRPEWRPGSLAVIADHINLSGANPLIGDPTDQRFVPMTDAYDPGLRAQLRAAAERAGSEAPEGVYAWFSGPNFETPAEVRMAARLGADLVGMSTVPETLLARRFGLKVAAVSMVTNLGAGIEGAAPSHAETKEIAGLGGAKMRALARAFVKEFQA